MENRTCRKNKNTPQTLQKVYIPRRKEESYRLLTTFKRKFVQWNPWATGSTRWQTVMADDEEEEESERRTGLTGSAIENAGQFCRQFKM
jgi:hypothetical protein